MAGILKSGKGDVEFNIILSGEIMEVPDFKEIASEALTPLSFYGMSPISSLFAVIILGWVAGWKGFIPSEFIGPANCLVFHLAIPPMIPYP